MMQAEALFSLKNQRVLALIAHCREEKNIDRKIELLLQLNEILPYSSRLKLPSLVTNDYVQRALEVIEESICDPMKGSVSAS
jgi:hypothetical protein